jgi:tetratricopeptide (TPR) repeat protein
MVEPMKQLAALAAIILLSPILHAQASLKQAREDWLKGYYAEAREMYEKLAKDAKARHPATLGLSQALQSQGEYDKAQSVVETLLKDMPKDADLLARLSELHYLRGRLDDAEKQAKAALGANKENFLGHWVLGQVLRDRGLWKDADEHFLWFVRQSNTKEITNPDELRLVGLAGLERARHLHLNDQYQTIISDYFGEAEKLDKLYWPAAYEAGRVFADKHNKPAAFRAFERALIVNPLAPEVLVAKGQMAASSFEFKDADKYASQALKINPRMVPALNLMAEVHWFSNEDEQAMKLLTKARDVNPRDEGTLARIAAYHYAKKDTKAFDAVVKEARTNNPKCYTFYSDLGTLLDQRKFHDDAEKYFLIAFKMEPNLAEASIGLGMMYMRMAKEKEAREILEKAFKADEFNVRVSNSLLVLDHLDRYEELKTDHFILRYDKKNDTVLANYMAVYLEQIYKELADQFDYRPKGPFQIQIFSRHEMFSGRVVAVPDLHTIGACTGPLVAMVSPKDTSGVIGKPFNWNRVIRHELVHVFNLQQTKGNVPHWFTEGLAVRYEGPNIPPSWHALLADKFNNDDLLNLDNILLGFIRPRSPLQWQQAYLQSLLYVEYLTKTHGEKSIGKMLAAFQEGLDTGPALEKACNVKKDVFEKGYREFLRERVKNIPVPPAQKNLTLKQLREQHAKNPNDLDLTAQLAEKNYQLGKKKDAKELTDKVLRQEPRHPTAVYVKSLLFVDEGERDKAYSLLDTINNDEIKDTKPLKLLAQLQMNMKKYPQAATTCERGRKIDPHEQFWILQLAKIYVQTKEKEKLVDIFEEVARIDPDDFTSRKLLAQHYQGLNKNADAEKYARMALEVDVTDRVCQDIYIEALNAQNRQEEANRWKAIFAMGG